MTTNINELAKIKVTLAFKRCLAFAIKFLIISLLFLNVANLFFAGLITKLIIRWVNSLFNYTIPHTIPDWFAFYVIILYVIVLVALSIPCHLVLEKLEDFKKYDIASDITYLRSRIEGIKKEISENILLETYSGTKAIPQINDIIQQTHLPEKTKLLETQNTKETNSIIETLNENRHPQSTDANKKESKISIKNDTIKSNSQDLNYQEPAKEIDINIIETVTKSAVVKNTLDNLTKDKTDAAGNEQNDEKNEKESVDNLNPISHLENEIESFTEDKMQEIVYQEPDEKTPINVIDSLNEIFVSKENIVNISEENEIAEVNSALPKMTAEDYIDRNKAKQDIGLKGEYFILRYEKSELIKNNRSDLAIKVKHISKDEGDYVGYDILSYDVQGNEKYIEVKTSVKGYTADFFLTENEMNKIKKLEHYFIYRVFDFDTQAAKGNLYIVNCKKDFLDYFIIQPTQYKVSPRKK